MGADPIHVESQDQFNALLAANKYVVADFYADWCPPCKAIAPLYGKLATTHSKEGQLAFAKVNVDNVSDVAQTYGVTAMPTFLFFTDGKPAPVDLGAATGGASNGVAMIRGADPRGLTAVVTKLGQLAQAAAAENSGTEEKPKVNGVGAAAAAEQPDLTTVSGSYTLGSSSSSGRGRRADWKMSLQG